MINIWLAVILILVISAGCAAAAFIFGKKKGAKEREKEILIDYVWYIPVKDLAEFAREAMEERGVEEDYPLLVIRSDKYDYIEGDDLPSEKRLR